MGKIRSGKIWRRGARAFSTTINFLLRNRLRSAPISGLFARMFLDGIELADKNLAVTGAGRHSIRLTEVRDE